MENTVRQNPNKSIREFYLNNGQLGGGNVQSIDVRGETSEGLLGTVGAEGKLASSSYITKIERIKHTEPGC